MKAPGMVQYITFISTDVDFCSLSQSPVVNVFGADFLHFTIFAMLRNDEMTAWAGRPAAQPVNMRSSFLLSIVFFV